MRILGGRPAGWALLRWACAIMLAYSFGRALWELLVDGLVSVGLFAPPVLWYWTSEWIDRRWSPRATS